MQNKGVVNAGGSKTVVALFGGKRRECLFPGANINTVKLAGVSALAGQIAEAIGQASLNAKLLVGFAGAARKSDFDAIKAAFEQVGFKGELEVVSDFELYLRAIEPETLLLLAGTGCLGAIKIADELLRIGGWGPLSGERGSGLQLGRDAILSAQLSSEGRVQESALVQAVPRALGFERIGEVVKPLHAGEISHAKIASLSRVVCELARKGDLLSKELIAQVGSSLASIVNALERKTLDAGPKRSHTKLALAGGLFEGDGRDLFMAALSPHISPSYEFIFFGSGPSDINLLDTLLLKL